MGLDISLTAVPIEMDIIFEKAKQKSNTEYPDILCSLPNAFRTDFCDFGHPDWIEFRKDANELLQYYPNKKFKSKYYFNPNRAYDVIDYLIAAFLNNTDYRFLNDGIEFNVATSSQGFALKYWNQEMLHQKADLLEKITYNDLMQHYDFKKMKQYGVYKITQIHHQKEAIETTFADLKYFLNEAKKINGYVIITKI